MPHPTLLPSLSLCWRELIRFVRQRNRIIGALATPIVFWLLIGGGLGHSFHAGGPGGDNFIEYFFPGTLLMILLFTAIFSTISIIEDRREGFLQAVLVAPVPRAAIVLGKVLGGTVLAVGQGLLFLCLAPTVGIRPGPEAIAVTLLTMLVVGFVLTALGFCVAWRMGSTQGFHVIMNLFFIPMWLLSGAVFPASTVAVAPLRWLMRINPLTYAMAALRQAMYLGRQTTLANWFTPMGVTIVCAALIFGLAVITARVRIEADLL